MKKLLLVSCLLTGLLICHSLGQVAYSSTSSTYTENFNSLGTNSSSVWANNTTIAGWYALGSATNPAVIANQNGNGTSGTLANFGSTNTSADRSLGWVYANSVGAAGSFASIGFGISNATGFTLDSFSLGYTGREWRGYSNNTPTLSFQYKIGGTFDNNSTTSLDGNTAWTAFNALDFILPVTNNNLRVDGSVSPNFTTLSNTITGLTWANDEVLWIRWRQQNLSGTDAQMAIDDVVFNAVPEPSTYALLALSGLALAGYAARRRRR